MSKGDDPLEPSKRATVIKPAPQLSVPTALSDQSRTKAIEELPVALGLLKITEGDVTGSILGATNYGRDSDSIATMGGAIAGALGGADSVPEDWRETVGRASRLDLAAIGLTMAAVAAEVFTADEKAFAQRQAAFGALQSSDSAPTDRKGR